MNPTERQYTIAYLVGKGVEFDDGLSHEEVGAVERAYGFTFPPDLRQWLMAALPVSKGFVDWRSGDPKDIRERMDQPLEGILFDVEYNGFWMKSWGARPEVLRNALDVARVEVRKAPALIPIYGHRYLPSAPCEEGNPVLSVQQTDIIVYGINIVNYFSVEFGIFRSMDDAPIKKIPFWSYFIED